MTGTTPSHASGAVDVTVNGSATLHNGYTFVSILARPVLTAMATSVSQVALSWGAITGADHYEISRYQSGAYSVIGTTSSTSYNDGGRSADTTYVYIVRAVGTANAYGPYSAPDVATTTFFTDDPLATNVTAIKAVHITQLRTAVNALRTAAGLSTATFTDSSLTGVRVKAVHITELRSALDSALAALSLPAVAYAHSISANVPVSAVDLTEIRNALK
jgi:fibronectin type 3 domain-containing protein